MNRSVLVAIAMMATVTAFGQYRQTAGEVELTPTQSMNTLNARPSTTLRGGISQMTLWYGALEGEVYGVDQTEYIWDLHSYADSADNQLNRVVVAYPYLQDMDDPNGSNVIPWDNVIGCTIDTIFIQLGHENNSGTTDTLRIQVVDLTGSGRPSTNVLWEQIVTTDTSFTGGTNWTNSAFIPFTPGITVSEAFGVRVDYFGSKQDTFGIVAGFYEDGLCTGTTPKALESLFAVNTYRWLSRYDFAGWLPQSGGGDIYYDCNDDNDYTQGIDGEHFTQNVNFAVSLTIEDDLSTDELPENLVSVRNYPNPFSHSTTVEYTLDQPAAVNFRVYDLTGAVLMSSEYGYQTPGSHEILVEGSNLAEGIYYYTLSVNGGTTTNKMILTR